MAKISIDIKGGTIINDEFIFGIDLGTTNSLISYTRKENSEPEIIRIDNNGLVPSVVYFENEDTILVGQKAKIALENSTSSKGFNSIKRFIGCDNEEVRRHFSSQFENLPFLNQKDLPVYLSTLILKFIKESVEKKLKTIVKKVVITVPAYFNDKQRQATQKAGEDAGLQVLRIINEPTAAALAYGLQSDTQCKVAIYDLGGGTFDVSILNIDGDVFDVLSTNGNTRLGGDDFDEVVWKILEKSGLQSSNSPSKNLQLAKEIKQQLTSQSEIFIENSSIKITNNEFEKDSKLLIDKTLESCTKALEDAELTKEEIDHVVLIGGATRMPIIRKAVEAFFQKTAKIDINPDEAVALGAGVQANILSGKNTDTLLIDVTPLSLGIETMGGLMDVIIPRNSKLPCAFAKQYTTQKDGQTNISIALYQGERDMVVDNIALGQFILSGIPAMPATFPKLEVRFIIDVNGILSVSAKELRSGIYQELVIKPIENINDEIVDNQLLNAFMHAKDDMNQRQWTEIETEAILLQNSTRKFMSQHEYLFDSDSKQEVQRLLNQLKSSFEIKDKDQTQKFMDELNNYCRPYAEKAMDFEVSKALKGKGI